MILQAKWYIHFITRKLTLQVHDTEFPSTSTVLSVITFLVSYRMNKLHQYIQPQFLAHNNYNIYIYIHTHTHTHTLARVTYCKFCFIVLLLFCVKPTAVGMVIKAWCFRSCLIGSGIKPLLGHAFVYTLSSTLNSLVMVINTSLQGLFWKGRRERAVGLTWHWSAIG
jgi:hypothetical protein